MDENVTEKTKRIDIVWGIAVAGAIGFILNLSANLYYDLFIVHTVTWANVAQGQVVLMGLALLGLIGFLNFFIDDYKNGFEINKTLIRRFAQYFFYEFRPGKVIRVITGVYLLLILSVILIFIYIEFAKSSGYLLATVAFGSMFVAVYIKEKRQRSLKTA